MWIIINVVIGIIPMGGGYVNYHQCDNLPIIIIIIKNNNNFYYNYYY